MRKRRCGGLRRGLGLYNLKTAESSAETRLPWCNAVGQGFCRGGEFIMDIIKTSELFAKKEYAKHDEIHQWDHIEDVMNVALKLTKFYSKVDLEILKLAIIFHDISYEQYETHVEESIKVAKKFFKEQDYPEDKTKKVLQVMISHSGPHRKKFGEAKSIEEKIIYDSDKLHLAKTKEGFEKYHDKFYLDETRDLLRESCPEFFPL